MHILISNVAPVCDLQTSSHVLICNSILIHETKHMYMYAVSIPEWYFRKRINETDSETTCNYNIWPSEAQSRSKKAEEGAYRR
jgi:hypothetical protein